MQLVEMVYKITRKLPKEEMYGLVSQMRRSAVSIPSNIAEGQQRINTREFTQFLGIALASGAELETQLILTERLYSEISCREAVAVLEEIQKMASAIIKKLTNH